MFSISSFHVWNYYNHLVNLTWEDKDVLEVFQSMCTAISLIPEYYLLFLSFFLFLTILCLITKIRCMKCSLPKLRHSDDSWIVRCNNNCPMYSFWYGSHQGKMCEKAINFVNVTLSVSLIEDYKIKLMFTFQEWEQSLPYQNICHVINVLLGLDCLVSRYRVPIMMVQLSSCYLYYLSEIYLSKGWGISSKMDCIVSSQYFDSYILTFYCYCQRIF